MTRYKWLDLISLHHKAQAKQWLIRKARDFSGIPYQHPIERFLCSPWMQHFGISLGVDVGANEGQFAQIFRTAFPEATLVSFEPIDKCFNRLKDNFKNDKNFHGYKTGVGAKKEQISFHPTDFSPASSFLKIKQDVATTFSIKRAPEATKIQVDTLDNLLAPFELRQPAFLKVDTQGFELNVLKGAQKTLQTFTLVLLELSLSQMYEDEPLFDEIYRFMTEHGFVMRAVLDVLKDPKTGKHLQVDVLFEKA